MTTIEQELEAELSRLRTAVSYIEEANQRTAEALAAAATVQTENQQLQAQLHELQQRLDKLEMGTPAVSPAPLPVLLGVGCLLLIGSSSWLWRRRT